MKIHGLQKMTLLDFPGRVACTVFFGGCDFRCPFCHNYELADGSAQATLTEEELFSFLGTRKGLLDGVAITGGEPCLNRELERLLARIRDMGFLVKLDTNGYHPEKLRNIFDAHLADYVAMDIKNSPGKYDMTAGLPAGSINMERIEESIRLLMSSGVEYEFRTTVARELHEAEDFKEIGELIRGAEKYYLQPFVNRDTVPDRNLTAPTEENLRKYAEIARNDVKIVGCPEHFCQHATEGVLHYLNECLTVDVF